jgi:hypothetical protein
VADLRRLEDIDAFQKVVAAVVASLATGLTVWGCFASTPTTEGVPTDWSAVTGAAALLGAIVWVVVYFSLMALQRREWRIRHPAEAARIAAAQEATKRGSLRREVAEKYPARPTSSNAQEAIEYQSYGDFEVDRDEWLAHGWRIASVSDVPQRAGIGRFAMLGLGAVVLKPGAHVFVIYERTAVTPPQPAVPTIACPTCGTANTPDRAFCGNCGRRTAQTMSLSAELERIASLRDAGTLTAEEFDRAKQRLLNG